MITEQFHVPAISCEHCVRAITEEVSALAGVKQVRVALDSKQVSVEHTEAISREAIIAAIQEAGYDEVALISG